MTKSDEHVIFGGFCVLFKLILIWKCMGKVYTHKYINLKLSTRYVNSRYSVAHSSKITQMLLSVSRSSLKEYISSEIYG